jgi:hypothetical protein
MGSPLFVGRKNELEKLTSLYHKNLSTIVVVKGRRRIGKSRLINCFASKYTKNKLWDFAGLAPQAGMDDQTQRDHFARQLALHLKVPPFTFQDWSDAFEYLSVHLKSGDIVLLDEISWMGAKDPSFISKLKVWCDKQTLPVMVVFCGSVSTWIEENILKSTAFFGRINLTITLEPLLIPEANKLLKSSGYQGSDYDTFKLLSILGGIPWYLEQVARGKTADTLIKELCFEKDGILVLEFERIFHDLFNGKGATYKKILNSLKEGMRTLAEIRKNIEFPHSGTLSSFMEHLIIAGFVKKQNLWSFKTTKPLKQSLYRICDPYMRFYLKLIEPRLNKIFLGAFQNISITSLPGFEAHIGLQIEQLLLQNRSLLLKSIGINQADIVADGPFRQTQTSTKKGCQIDYLVQTVTKNIFICEFKFKRGELSVDVINQVQEKIDALKVPRGFATIPVLFHIGGVSSSLATNEYFYRIIDITTFL